MIVCSELFSARVSDILVCSTTLIWLLSNEKRIIWGGGGGGGHENYNENP